MNKKHAADIARGRAKKQVAGKLRGKGKPQIKSRSGSSWRDLARKRSELLGKVQLALQQSQALLQQERARNVDLQYQLQLREQSRLRQCEIRHAATSELHKWADFLNLAAGQVWFSHVMGISWSCPYKFPFILVVPSSLCGTYASVLQSTVRKQVLRLSPWYQNRFTFMFAKFASSWSSKHCTWWKLQHLSLSRTAGRHLSHSGEIRIYSIRILPHHSGMCLKP